MVFFVLIKTIVLDNGIVWNQLVMELQAWSILYL